MYNYTLQFRYNKKEDSIPFPSDIEYKKSDHPLSLHTKVYPFVKQHLEAKQLWKGHEFMEILRLYKGDELIYDMSELDNDLNGK